MSVAVVYGFLAETNRLQNSIYKNLSVAGLYRRIVIHYPGRQYNSNTTNNRRIDSYTDREKKTDINILYISIASNNGVSIFTRRHRSHYQRSTDYRRYIRSVRLRTRDISEQYIPENSWRSREQL